MAGIWDLFGIFVWELDCQYGLKISSNIPRPAGSMQLSRSSLSSFRRIVLECGGLHPFQSCVQTEEHSSQSRAAALRDSSASSYLTVLAQFLHS